MSQDKLPPEGAEHRAPPTTRLQEQHDTLQRPALPSLAQALAEVGMEEAPMRSLPTKEATAHPGPPSIHLLTGLVTGEASPEEEALWDQHYADDPQAQARLSQLQQWTASDALAESEAHHLQREQQALLQRGQRLLKEYPPLPQLEDFFKEAQREEAFAQEAMAPEATEATEATLVHDESPHGGVGEAPPVGLGAPAPEEYQEHQPSPSPGWQSWLGWSMPMALAMGWLLLIQPPVDRTIPSMGSGIQEPGQRPNSIPIYRPAPAKAQPKGLDQRTTPPAATGQPIVLKLLRKRGGQVQTMPSAFVVKDADMARFVVKNASQKRYYIALFLVEQSGVISYLYPSRAGGKMQLPSSRAGAFLKGGVALSAPTKPERIYGCVTLKPLSPDRLKAFARRVKGGDRLRSLARLPLPCVYQTSWLLMPPGH